MSLLQILVFNLYIVKYSVYNEVFKKFMQNEVELFPFRVILF